MIGDKDFFFNFSLVKKTTLIFGEISKRWTIIFYKKKERDLILKPLLNFGMYQIDKQLKTNVTD